MMCSLESAQTQARKGRGRRPRHEWEGDAAGAGIRIATLNVGRNLPAKLGAVIELASEFKVDVFCLQEVGVNEYAAETVRAYAATAGWQIFFGGDMIMNGTYPTSEVAIMARGAMTRTKFEAVPDDRQLTVRMHRRGHAPWALCCVYGHANNQLRAMHCYTTSWRP